jgi:hypothetical protein
MKEIPELYEIAKQITLDAGYPYTDPRTLETTKPKMNKIKKPAWVLFEQLHIDVHISTRMAVTDRTVLRNKLNSVALRKSIENLVLINSPEPSTEVSQVKVQVTR